MILIPKYFRDFVFILSNFISCNLDNYVQKRIDKDSVDIGFAFIKSV